MLGDDRSDHLIPVIAQLRDFQIRYPMTVIRNQRRYAAQGARVTARLAEVLPCGLGVNHPLTPSSRHLGDVLEHRGGQFALVEMQGRANRLVRIVYIARLDRAARLVGPARCPRPARRIRLAGFGHCSPALSASASSRRLRSATAMRFTGISPDSVDSFAGSIGISLSAAAVIST